MKFELNRNFWVGVLITLIASTVSNLWITYWFRWVDVKEGIVEVANPEIHFITAMLSFIFVVCLFIVISYFAFKKK